MKAPYGNVGPILLDAPEVHRVWGGNRFSADDGPIGEVWLVHESNVILQGPCAGSTLAAAVETMGSALLGHRLAVRGEREFPLLVKLIDAAEWLSIQVHPDDVQAELLEGPGHRGKTEAWYILGSNPGAEIIAGIKPGVTAFQAEQAIRSGDVLDFVQRFEISPGDAVTLPAGAVHALGPGLFIYEIQQSSALTYRIYDWDRPAGEGRSLHIEQSLQSAKPSLRIAPAHIPNPGQGDLTLVAESEYFQVKLGRAGTKQLPLEPGGETFHIVTIIQGDVVLRGAGWKQVLKTWDTALIPASIVRYSIEGLDHARFLLATPV